MSNYVAYIRVSTQRQGKSGLGLDAQRQRILDFVGDSKMIVRWFKDHESGGKADRDQLEKALSHCELTGATLLVATLDRLSRDVLFLETVKRRCDAGGFDFRCCDMPDANSFMLGVMAQLAQYERERIRERTKAALAQAKARGVKLGSPHGARYLAPHREQAWQKAGETHRTKADNWAEKRRPLIEDMVKEGLSNRAIARKLAEQGINTPRGGAWTATGVKRLLNRLELSGNI